jgi:dTDP-D-glucose 4,6-dehydratase
MLLPLSNPELPFDVLNIILQYDGRIKYSHKRRIYVNIITKNDYRYNVLETKINNKIDLIQNFNIGNNGLNFYIDVYYKNNTLCRGLIFSKKLL